MKTAYKVLAYLVAAEVAIQAMAVVWAIAGLGKWVDGGGVLDKAVMESDASPFPRAAVVDHLVLHQGPWRDQVGRDHLRAGGRPRPARISRPRSPRGRFVARPQRSGAVRRGPVRRAPDAPRATKQCFTFRGAGDDAGLTGVQAF